MSVSNFFFKKKTARALHVHSTCSCAVNSLNYYTCTTASLLVRKVLNTVKETLNTPSCHHFKDQG
jgi:hypothetical protein